METEVGIQLLTLPECFVYKVPPLKTASGHRAEEWGLDKPIFTGAVKVIQYGNKLHIKLYKYKDETTKRSDLDNLEEFGTCPIEIEPKSDLTEFVDSVADSSRYFVVRLKDPASTRHVHIGIGFRERDSALDLRSTLNDFVRFIDRMAEADSQEQNAQEEFELKSSGKDFSLKEGTKIHINVKGGGSRAVNPSDGGLKPPPSFTGLKPPPPSGSVVGGKEDEEEDWGDFETS